MASSCAFFQKSVRDVTSKLTKLFYLLPATVDDCDGLWWKHLFMQQDRDPTEDISTTANKRQVELQQQQQLLNRSQLLKTGQMR